MRRVLIDLKTKVMETEIDLLECVKTHKGKDREFKINFLKAKLDLERHTMNELEQSVKAQFDQ